MVTTSRPQQHQVQSYGATNTYENKNRGRMWWPQMQGCRSQWDWALHDFDRLGPVYSSNIAMLLLAPPSGSSYGPVKLCRRHSQALAFFFMS